MEERYLFAAARYIEMNPVRAGLFDRPGEYPWSSATAHILGRGDGLLYWSLLMIGGGLLACKSQTETSISYADTSEQVDLSVVRALSTGWRGH